jgi:hypothetical protein
MVLFVDPKAIETDFSRSEWIATGVAWQISEDFIQIIWIRRLWNVWRPAARISSPLPI